LNDEIIWKGALRILVEPTHIGMGRSGFEIVVALFDIFAVVSLRSGETE
jgi:hypothetical protein